MKKYIYYSLLFAGILTWGACDKAMEDNLPEEYASILFFDLEDGKNIVEFSLLKTGEQGTCVFTVGKGGNKPTNTAEGSLVILSEEELEDYNNNNNADYSLLPTSYYSLPETVLSFVGEEARKKLEVKFKTSEMDNELDKDKQYVVPIRLESQNNSVNEELNLLILKPTIEVPTITTTMPNIVDFSMDANGETTEENYSVAIYIPLNENKWDFTAKFENDRTKLEEAVTTYKQQYPESDTYKLMPEGTYTLPTEVIFTNGKLLVNATTTFNCASLGNGDYLLPIILTECVGQPFEVDKKPRFIHLSVKDILPEVILTEEMFSQSTRPEMGYNWGETEHKPDLLIDGNPSTYWQSEWTRYTTPGQSEKPHDPKYGLYIDIVLTKPIEKFAFAYYGMQQSSALPNPKDIDIYIGESADKLDENPIKQLKDLPNMNTNAELWTSDNYRCGKSIKHIRLAITKNQENADLCYKGNSSATIAELRLYGK